MAPYWCQGPLGVRSMEREIGEIAAKVGLRGFRYLRFPVPAFADAPLRPEPPQPEVEAAAAEGLDASPSPAAAALPAAEQPAPATPPTPRPAPASASAFALLGEVAAHRPTAPAAARPTRPSRRPGAFAALAARQATTQDS